ELPGREARALEIRARFVGEDALEAAVARRGTDDAERGAISGRGKGARVAMREHTRALRQQGRAEIADKAAGGEILGFDGLRFLEQGGGAVGRGADLAKAAAHPLDGPTQVDRRGSGFRERTRDLLEMFRL